MADANVNNSSFRGTFLRTMGYFCTAIGAATIFQGDAATGAAAIVVGICLAALGSSINENKRFKLWKKEVQAKNLEPVIRRDLATAISVYNTFPTPKTLAYIRSLNPEAAKYIEEKTAAKKK